MLPELVDMLLFQEKYLKPRNRPAEVNTFMAKDHNSHKIDMKMDGIRERLHLAFGNLYDFFFI